MADNYLVLNEKRNAMDFLMQSLNFLSQVNQNKFYLKWFIIAFHGALHSFMFLAIQTVDQKQIYSKLPAHFINSKDSGKKGFNPLDGKLLDFKETYSRLKDPKIMGGESFQASELQDKAMKELNDDLRNQMMHFKPSLTWGSEPWYPARVSIPLIEVMEFCLDYKNNGFTQPERSMGKAYLKSINVLLTQYLD